MPTCIKWINICSAGNSKLYSSVYPQLYNLAKGKFKQMLQLHLLNQEERIRRGIINHCNEVEQLSIYADPKTDFFFCFWHSHLISICTPAPDQVVSDSVNHTREVGGNQLALLEAAACFLKLVHFFIYLQLLAGTKVKFCMQSLLHHASGFDEATDALSIQGP